MAGLLAAPAFASRYMLQILLTIVLYVQLVTAWNILSGFTGYLFLGVAAFYGIAGYAYAIVSQYLPYLIAIPLVGVLCFAISYAIGMLLLRIRGPYFAIASYALVLLFANVVLYYEQTYSRVTGRVVSVLPVATTYLTLLGITVATIGVAYLIKRSKFGYGLSYVKGNEDLANVVGINAPRYKCLAFGVSAFFIGMAAAAIVPRGGYIDTTVVFAPAISFNTLVMGVVGGLGSIRGGVLSATFFSLLFELFGTSANPYPLFMLMGLLLMIVIFAFPQGIEGMIARVSTMRVASPQVRRPDRPSAPQDSR
jgi:branched-chain amino acid transport system permease protein